MKCDCGERTECHCDEATVDVTSAAAAPLTPGAAATGGLDVEALAVALRMVCDEKWPNGSTDIPVTVFGGYAEDIAAAYAAAREEAGE